MFPCNQEAGHYSTLLWTRLTKMQLFSRIAVTLILLIELREIDCAKFL